MTEQERVNELLKPKIKLSKTQKEVIREIRNGRKLILNANGDFLLKCPSGEVERIHFLTGDILETNKLVRYTKAKTEGGSNIYTLTSLGKTIDIG